MKTRLESASGFAVISGAKSDLPLGVLYLLGRRLKQLSECDPEAARQLRRRIVYYDFASSDPVSPYSLTCRLSGMEPEVFAGHRLDLLLDLLPDAESLELARPVLKSLLQLCSEPGVDWPLPYLLRALGDEAFLTRGLSECGNAGLVRQLRRQLATVAHPTLAALRRRLEVVVSSESLRLALSGTAAPDFRKLQDESCFLVVDSAGPNIPASVAQLLQTAVVSDLCRGTLSRQRPEAPFLVIIDEAQQIFRTRIMRELLDDATRLARSFGTRFCFVTQNLSAAVPDAKLIGLLETNCEWHFALRGQPGDCACLRPFLPITGRRKQPKGSPFEPTRYYSPSQERTLVHEGIAALPNRSGYFLLRGRMAEALRLDTATLEIPQGRALLEATRALRHDPSFGRRVSRKEYDRLLSERERKWEPETTDVGARLEAAYRKGT